MATADEAGALASGFFPLQWKQHACWHLTPLGEGTAARMGGPGTGQVKRPVTPRKRLPTPGPVSPICGSGHPYLYF